VSQGIRGDRNEFVAAGFSLRHGISQDDKPQAKACGYDRHYERHYERHFHRAAMVLFSALFTATALLLPSANAGDKPLVVFRVVSPELPSRFSPLGPLTDADRQAQDLLFEPLIAASRDETGTVRYRPGLAEAIPFGEGTQLTFRIRANAAWSNGEPVTASDLRHSLEQLQKDAGAAFAWSSLLDPPLLGNTPREVRLSLRHGLIVPWECFTFPIVPQQSAENGKKPLGSGPFVLVGPVKGAAAPGIQFRKNPHYLLASKLPFDEIHWFAAAGAKEIAALKPDLVFGFEDSRPPPNASAAVTQRVWYVAPNHRHPLLAKSELRGFLGASIERDKIIGSDPRLSVNGLTTRGSWAQAAPPRVPDDLHRPEIARALANELAKAHKSVALTFKFPASQADRMGHLIDQWHAAAQAGGLNLKVQPVPLPAADFAAALAKHDFELALVGEDHGDSIGRLTALFDSRKQALAPGGSNFLGVQEGVQQQIANLPSTRRFSSVRDQMHNLHVQLVQSTQPVLIPLWQHRAHYSLNPVYRVRPFDPLRPFADLSAWRK
jgi:ABC-type oligopeptide transport system substrate-binding subunit